MTSAGRVQVTTLLASLATAAACVAPSGVPAALRALPIAAYVLLIPGYAMTQHVTFPDQLLRGLMIGVLGLAITAASSEALAIAQVWSPLAVILIIGAFSSLSLLVAERTNRRRAKGS